MRIKITYLLLFFYLGVGILTQAQAQAPGSSINISDTFPVPRENKNLLFYIQRTHNKNTIMYELNCKADSSINLKEPVKAYWIRYSDHGETAPLSYIQNNYAYGIESLMTDSAKKSFRLNLVSYKKRYIYLVRAESGDKRYHAYMSINNKLAQLVKVFAKIDGGTFWMPHVTYIEITGKDPQTGKKVVEKIIP